MTIHEALKVIARRLPLRDIYIGVPDDNFVICEGWVNNFEHAGAMVDMGNPENLDPDDLETALIRFAEEVGK